MIESVKRMVTSCPECDTNFYVKPEQLAVRKGYVRCGHCQHRFNALDFMLPERALKTDSSPLDNEQTTVEPPASESNTEGIYTPIALEEATMAMPHDRDAIVDTLIEAPSETPQADSNIAHLETAEPVPDSTAEAENPLQGHQSPIEQQTDIAESGLQEVDAEPPADISPETRALVETIEEVSAEPASLTYNSIETTNTVQEDSPVAVMGATSASIDFTNDFARNNRFKAKQSSPLVSWILKIVAALLVLFAIAQALYFGRTQITSHIPNLKPYLEQACLVIGCVIELPKDITKINIDDSDLKEDMIYQDLIHVSATIINQADISLAYPNLELTLTDEDNKPILRRIFKPSDYVEKGVKLSLGLLANQEVYVDLNVTVAGSRVVGYRLLPRYE